jgi:hypothetical protein
VSEISDLSARRWRDRPDPNDHTPVEALRAALRAVERGEIDPEHIIVGWSGDDDRVGYYQSGKLDHYASIGLLERIKHMIMIGE